MTQTKSKPKKRQRLRTRLGRITVSEAILACLTLFCILLLLRSAELAVGLFVGGLRLCLEKLLPTLFPHLILSELLLSNRTARRLLTRMAKPLSRPLRLSPDAASMLLVGLLCGFPVGVRAAVKAKQSGELEADEAERVLACSDIPSAVFLINTAGGLLGDRGFGLLLWVASLLYSLCAAAVLGRLSEKKAKQGGRESTAFAPTSLPRLSAATALTQAIGNSTRAMAAICAYVVFFLTLIGTVLVVATPLGITKTAAAMLYSVFELSGGVGQAAALTARGAARSITAFAVGWSGLSVHCQAAALTDGSGLSCRRHMLVKLAQAAVFLIAAALVS